VEILQGEKSPESSLKSVDKIRSQGRRTIPDHHIWESYVEDSCKVFSTLQSSKCWKAQRK
jgi:hypothetical protein